MAKAAFATWRDRIAPVFDASQWIQLVETKAGAIISQMKVNLAEDIPNLKASRLAELEVDTLVCGAISKPLQAIISAYGIEVISFVAGNLQEVIQAWLCDRITTTTTFTMPGCQNAGRHGVKWSKGSDRKERNMNSNRQRKGGAGQTSGPGRQASRGQKGAGRGQGRTGQCIGSDGGSSAAQGTCVCPQCGHREAHQRGIPCMQQKCAQCGSALTRS